MAKYTTTAIREETTKTQYAVSITGPAEAAAILVDEMRKHDHQEGFYALTLNTKNSVTGLHLISLGSLNASIVHPREIFFHAIGCKSCGRKSAASIILAHNHPSSSTEPSREDIEFSKRFAKCGELIGIQLLDSLIIDTETGRFESLKEKGIF